LDDSSPDDDRAWASAPSPRGSSAIAKRPEWESFLVLIALAEGLSNYDRESIDGIVSLHSGGGVSEL